MDEYEAHHAEFLDELDESSPAIFAFGLYMNGKEFSVLIPKKKRAPTHRENRAYRDSGDIFTLDDNLQIARRIEVKGRTCAFTCAEDWPYPDVFVAREDSVKAALADPRTWFFVTVSADLRFAAIIRPSTRESWRVADEWIPARNQRETYFACPTKLVEFRQIAP